MEHIRNLNKKVVLGSIWSFVAVSLVILGTTFFVTENNTVAVVALTAAAVITEGAIWLSAALLGLAVVDARKKLWSMLRGKA